MNSLQEEVFKVKLGFYHIVESAFDDMSKEEKI